MAKRQRKLVPYVHWLLSEGKVEELLTELDTDPAAVNSIAPDHVSLLCRAIASRNVELMHELLQRGASLNSIPRALETPLTAAIEFEPTPFAMVTPLCDAGASIHDAGYYGPPLHTCIVCDRVDVAELLIELGVNVDEYFDDVTPLHLAALKNSVEFVALLCKNGANPHSRCQVTGRTPLEIAEQRGLTRIHQIMMTKVE